MKTQMRARPVYHRTDRAIKAHFAICFVALFLYRVLEHRLGNGFSTDMILDALKRMNALHVPSEGFIPAFKRTNITDKLFEMSGFRLDTEIVQLKKLNPSSPQQRDVYSTKSEKSRSSLTIDSQQLAATAISYKVSKMGKLHFFLKYSKSKIDNSIL